MGAWRWIGRRYVGGNASIWAQFQFRRSRSNSYPCRTASCSMDATVIWLSRGGKRTVCHGIIIGKSDRIANRTHSQDRNGGARSRATTSRSKVDCLHFLRRAQLSGTGYGDSRYGRESTAKDCNKQRVSVELADATGNNRRRPSDWTHPLLHHWHGGYREHRCYR